MGRAKRWMIAFGWCFLQGCSLQQLAVAQAAAILKEGQRAFDRETDLELARAVAPASLAAAEGLLQTDPQQRDLHAVLARGYTGFAFGFLEDEAEAVDDADPERAAHLRHRAQALYLRARAHGLHLLQAAWPTLARDLRAGRMPRPEQLAALQSRDAAAVFWVANPWAAAINVGKADPGLLAQREIVRRLFACVVRLDGSTFYAGAHMGLGMLEAAVPRALGGDPDVAAEHFARAIARTEGKHLLTRVLFARFVGIQRADRAFFVAGMQQVLRANPDVAPDLALANRLAQRRARRYLALVDDIFLPE